MCKTSTHPDSCDEQYGLKGACASCPFNDPFTAEAAEAQNYGCLPTGYDIIQIKRRSGQNWACHDDETKVCAGLCHQAADAKLDLSQGNLVKYSSWYHAGEEESIQEAKTGFLVMPYSGPQFERAMAGYRRADGAFEPPTLRRPKLTFVGPRSHSLSDDLRWMWVACGPAQIDPDTGYALRDVLGVLELDTNPLDAKEAWLSFITVSPEFSRRGLAKRMLTGMAEHLLRTKQHLKRSFASDEGREKIQAYIDTLLDEKGIAWTQSDR